MPSGLDLFPSGGRRAGKGIYDVKKQNDDKERGVAAQQEEDSGNQKALKDC